MTLEKLKEHCKRQMGMYGGNVSTSAYLEHSLVLNLINEHENRAKHDSELLDKVADSITEIYKCHLYCAEDYCDKEQCSNAEDCFYSAIVRVIERMKAEVEQ